MVNTPDQICTMIEKWFSDNGIPYENVTASQKQNNPALEWALLLGKICLVYMINQRPDRVNVENPIKFSDKHQDASEKLDKKNFLDFIIDIKESPVIAGFSAVFESKNQRIIELKLSDYIDTEELTRGKLFHVIDKIAYMKAHVIRKVQTKLDLDSAPITDTQDTANKAMYG